jgi:hypothetical protein
MDTPTLPNRKPSKVYVQLPPTLQHVIDFDNYLQANGWKRKKYNYYNKDKRLYASAQQLYPLFRNINR